MRLRIERVRTSGVFTLDGQDLDVVNNVWLVGDDREVLVIDPAHEPRHILRALHGRRVVSVVCTHAHNDHINAAPGVARTAPILLHPDDAPLWQMTHPSRKPDRELVHGDAVQVAGVHLTVLHTPGHSPGGVCLYASDLGLLFSGDTLLQGGPGVTGGSYSDFPAIVDSVRQHLLTLPGETVVHAGHGEDTTIGAEAPQLDDWLARGY